MKVTLTWYEEQFASMVGIHRHCQALKGGYHDEGYGGEIEDPAALDIQGACAEMAYAKGMNVYWSGSINTFDEPDVGDDWIRYSSWDTGHLIIRAKKERGIFLQPLAWPKDGDVYWLVTGKSPNFVIRGWIRTIDAKHNEWFREFNKGKNGKPTIYAPAYFVPQEALCST